LQNILATTYPIKIIQKQGAAYILDGIRKKYVKCTPEEIVRQQLIQYLIETCHYPKGCISVEKRIKIGNRFLRYDIVVYKDIHPWMLIECKAPEIEINETIFLQSLIYQHTLQAQYIVLCNSIQTVCMNVETKQWMVEMVSYK
jgi:Type I restriction enzyme R protein N terminus (HSDR_N)